MANVFEVELRRDVVEGDLPALPRNLRDRILRAMERRLAMAPARYGVRLRKSLLGLWKLRVGDYRVVYEILGRTVRVHVVRHRKEAYQEALRRWRAGT